MLNDRLPQVEKQLNRLHEQLVGKEDTLTTIAPEEKVRIKQQISELKAEIHRYEIEYWEILANQPIIGVVSDPEPEVVVAELVEQVEQLQVEQRLSTIELDFLQKIYEKVNTPDSSATAKLKGVISLLPPYVNVAYETEIDTERFLKQNFPTFHQWIKAITKKK